MRAEMRSAFTWAGAAIVMVAGCAIGEHAHARILIAHVAFGDVLFGLLIVGELVGAEKLVATGETFLSVVDDPTDV